jgi:hypothetical protein
MQIVKDAVARLPDGLGTKSDVALMVKDSCFYASGVSDESLVCTVKSCLDRLSAEPDPCVLYDSRDQVWVYLH